MRQQLKVSIFMFKPRIFSKKYGKKTKAVAEPCNPKKKQCEIHIKSGLKKSDFKNTIIHELGHIITEKAKIASKISQKERKILKELAKTTLPKRKFIHRREPVREMLAIIYEKIKQKNKSQMKIINQEVPKTSELIKKAIRQIRIQKEMNK